MTIEEGIDNYVQTWSSSLDYFPAGYCSSHSGLYLKEFQMKMQFPAGVFWFIIVKGYILYDTGYHYEIKKKLGISGTV